MMTIRFTISLDAISCTTAAWETQRTGSSVVPEFRKEYAHRCDQKHRVIAKVAAECKLAVRLYCACATESPQGVAALVEAMPLRQHSGRHRRSGRVLSRLPGGVVRHGSHRWL